MAVQQGYGKMAGTDALVFAYDTGDAVNSYKGRPTTNYGPASFGNWGTEGSAERIATGNTYNGQPTYNCRTVVGESWRGIDTTISGLRTAAGSSGTVTMSCMVRNNNPSNYSMYAYIGHDFGSTRTIVANSNWQKVQWTVNQSSMNNDYVEFRPYTNNASVYLEMTMPMVEVNVSYASQFTAGTRSATEGLLDLTGTASIDLSNVSFDSDAGIVFDGTDDRIIFPPGSLPTIGTNDFTLEFVCKNTRTDRYNHFFSVLDQYHISFKSYNENGLLYVYRTSELSTTSSIPAYIPSRNDYYHIVAKRQGDNMQIYINGESQGLKTGWGDVSIDNNLYNSYIGWGAGTEYSGGHYAIAKIYNKALTDAEVSANFKNYKTRFNIA